MGVLRGFRHLPSNLRDWGEWFARQKIEAGLGNPDTDGQHLASNADGTRYWEAPPGFVSPDAAPGENAQRWNIKTFDTDTSPIAGDEDNVLLVCVAAGAINFFIEEDIFPQGSQLTVYQYGAGQITIVAGTNVSVKTPSNLTFSEQYATVTFIQVFPNDWVVAGRMTA